MIRLNKYLLQVCLLLLSAQLVVAQQYKASIDTVHQSGFYKIIILPEISAHCNKDFSDIRVVDSAGQQVPFIVRNSFPRFDSSRIIFIEFPILKNELTDSGKSMVVVENKLPGTLYELSLLIKNASVSRLAILSGSNDATHWYIIDDKVVIQESHEYKKDSYVQSLQFPVAAYKYLKLLINNAGTDPLNIIKTGFYEQETTDAGISPYVQNPVPSFTQCDSSNGKSYIKVINLNKIQFDDIDIQVTGSKFFSRKAEVILPLNDSTVDKLSEEPVASFLLQSNKKTAADISKQKAKVFYIVITNNDNPPFKINSIITRQIQNEIVTYLEKGKQYDLLLDNPAATQADYDLEKFRDSIPASIDSLKIGVIKAIKKTMNVPVESKPDNKKWIWLAIVLAGLVLTFFTYRLSKDINKSGI
jgi:hypothetical protein